MKKPRIFIVNNFDDVDFNSEGYISLMSIYLKGIRVAKKEKKMKENYEGSDMKIYELVEVKK